MLFTFKANTRSHPAISGKLFPNASRWTVRQPHQPSTRTSRIVSILIIWRAPRHARVVDEDMDLFFLGLDGLYEAVAPKFRLDIRRGVRTANQIFIFTCAVRRDLAYAQVGHNVVTRARAHFVQLF
jgi:hypothetical protein